MPGSARQLRLRPAAVALALGEAVELQDDADVVGSRATSIRPAQSAHAHATTGWHSSGAEAT